MFPRRQGAFWLALHLLYLGCLCAAFSVALWLRFSSGWWVIRDQPDLAAYVVFLVVAAAVWCLVARYYEIVEHLLRAPDYPAWGSACARAVVVSAVFVSAAAFCYRGYSFSRIAIALFWALHLGGTLALGALIFRLRGRLRPVELLVIGSNRGVLSLVAGGARVTFLDPGREPEIRRLRSAPPCDEVLVALTPEELSRLPAVLETLKAAPVPVRLALDLPEASAAHRAGSFLVLDIGACPADRLSYTVGKRALDIVAASLALGLGAPVAAGIALAIKLTSGGPILFRQERIGAGGRRFTLYKFRTLPVEPVQVTDRRWSETAPCEAGRLGRWLRRLGLDEWPQFWNVLRGEMSVVGPRPERPYFVEGFGEALTAYSLRLRLKPGITGWAQIQGCTGVSDISQRLEYDLAYLRHWSLGLDLKIMLLTPVRSWQRLAAAPTGRAAGAPAPREVPDHARSV